MDTKNPYDHTQKSLRRGGVEVLSKIRDQANNLIKPVVGAIARTGIGPNVLTFIGLLVGIGAAVFFARGEELLAGIFLLVAGFFDVIDGAVARVLKRETAFGGVLDSAVDRYVDFFIFAGIIYAFESGAIVEPGLMPGWVWGILAIIGSFMVSYTRARAEAAGSGKLDVGIAERAERLLILAIGAILGLTGYALTGYAVVLIVILTHLTVIQRLAVAWQRLR
jgi:archaetidylinositol phosphate synthase